MGMLFNTLYNLTDFWFAGRLSADALAGVSIAGSVFFLLLAVGIGIQAGASAVIAPLAGSGDHLAAADWADQVFGLGIVFAVLVMGLGLFAAQPLVRLVGAEAHIEPLAMQYVMVTLWGSIWFFLSFAAAGALMAFGDTRSNRNALAIGFFVNLGLNPLLTFGLGLGIRGLAITTVLIKAGSAIYLFWILSRVLGRSLKPRFDIVKWLALLRQILPASFNTVTIILGGFITVALVGRFGSDHVAGYSVGLRLEQVLLLPALGLNLAVMAIVGQNLGVGQYLRVQETYRTGLKVGLAMAAVGIPVMVYLSPAMMSFFTQDAAIQATGSAYLRIDAVAFYAYVILFLSTAALQAIKQPMFPMLMGIVRQLVIPVSVNYWLIVSLGFPMISIFYTIVTVVVMAAVVAHWYTHRQLAALNPSGDSR
ncbi:MAG: MATE family efflux transporter [Granulosicoccus sp.]|nr:MATE family efflux transporter [Granulosicoccus sp.]